MKMSRSSKHKLDRLVERFGAGTITRCAAYCVSVNYKTNIYCFPSAYCFHRLRAIIAHRLEKEVDPVFRGRIEVDES